MASRQRHDLKRRAYHKEPRVRFIVYCEGKNTEPAYFRALRQKHPTALIEVTTIPNAGVPYTLATSAVERAKQLKLNRRRRRHLNSFEEGDQVWAVFDRDEHPRYEEAIEFCKANNVGVARSDPCFELWLILHLEAYDKPDGRHAIQAHLERILPGYERNGGKLPDCAQLVPHVEQAEDRASRQLARRKQEGGELNRPSTTVGDLTVSIRVAAEKAI